MELLNLPPYSEKSIIDDTMNIISVRLRIDYENSTNKNNECPAHINKEISHYCRDCRSRMCLKCLDQHKTHDTIDKNFIILEKIDNISGIIERFCAIKSDVIDIISQCDQQKKTIFEDQKTSYEDIESKFTKLHMEIDNYKNELLMELQQVVDSCLSRLDTNKKELMALNDDISSITNLVVQNSSAFENYNLFELEEYAKQKLIHYTQNLPLDPLRPNQLNIQVKWTGNSQNAIKSPLAKINCHLSPEKLSHLRTLSVAQANDKRKSYINSICCDSNDLLFLCDSANNKIKVLNKDYAIERCFVGSGKHKLTSPANIISLSVASDNIISSPTSNNKQQPTVLVTDPGSQKVVIFNKFGMGVEMFETSGNCEAVSIISSLSELENCQECFLELSSIYSTVDPNETQEQYLNRPAIILCSKQHNLHLEFLQINQSSLKLCKSRADLTLSSINSDFCFFPKSMAWNSKSHLLFLLDSQEHKILIFSGLDGRFVRFYGRFGHGPEEFDYPTGILVDREGQVLIADKNNNRIHLLDPMGNFIKFLFNKNQKQVINQPTAICFDNDYNLIICEAEGKMKIFTY